MIGLLMLGLLAVVYLAAMYVHIGLRGSVIVILSVTGLIGYLLIALYFFKEGI